VTSTSTRTPIYKAFAKGENIGDVTAKGECVGNVADLVCLCIIYWFQMICSLSVAYYILVDLLLCLFKKSS